MATYEYKCIKAECKEFNNIKTINIPINEYNENKLPRCKTCGKPTVRNYTVFGHQTFGDGYKG